MTITVPERDEMHRSIGAFFFQYAQVELVLRLIIRAMSGLDESRFDILVGFPRGVDARKIAQRLAEVQGLPDDALATVREAFGRLTTLTALRDRLVHYGAWAASQDGKPIILVGAKALTTELDGNVTTQANLLAAVGDLDRVKAVFGAFLMPNSVGELERHRLEQLPSWQYEPL